MGSTAIIDLGRIAERLDLPVAGVETVVHLLDSGNTIPFITRYRRDQTGGLDEEQVRVIAESVARARQLADRKATIQRTIQSQGKLTPALEGRIAAAESLKQLEDLYLPFKPRKLSLAEIAKQRKLEPLAREILAADPAAAQVETRAADFVDPDVEVGAVADVLLGVGHIIAHEYSERADVRGRLREIFHRQARLTSQRIAAAGKSLPVFAGVVVVENLCNGLVSAAFVAYFMTLCEPRFAAAQYALLSGLMYLAGALVGATSGALVERLGYSGFFVLSIAVGVPPLLALPWAMPRPSPENAAETAA
jgi:hypothetical protein